LRFQVPIESLEDFAGTTWFRPQKLSAFKTNDKYTFAILRSGKIHFGHMRNSWEVGVKHKALAGEQEVVSAGELIVDKDGNYKFNIESGTYSKEIGDQISNETLLQNTHEALLNYFGKPGSPTMETFPKSKEPTFREILEMCKDFVFSKFNYGSCKELAVALAQ
jgi:hypothetical protein